MIKPMRSARFAAASVSIALALGAMAPTANAVDGTPVDIPASSHGTPGGTPSPEPPTDPEPPTEPEVPVEDPESTVVRIDPETPTDPGFPLADDTSTVAAPAVDPDLTPEDVLLKELLAKHMEDAVVGTSDVDSALVVSVPGMKVDVPRDATTEDVSLKLGELPALTVEMPQEAVDASAPAVIEGTVVYGNEETGAVSSVQALETKAVRMAVSVPSPDAPQTYSFDLGLSEGMKAELAIDGGIVVTTPITSDDTVAGITVDVPAYEIAAPWAKDANGDDVQTWYTLEGSTVTQHVNPRPDHVYPIVMDPTIGESIDKVGVEIRDLKRRLDNTGAAVTEWFNKWEALKAKVTGTESDIVLADRLKSQADLTVSNAQAEYDRRIAHRNRFTRGTATWNALDRSAADYKRITLDPAKSSQTTRKRAVDSLKETLKKHMTDRDDARQRYNNNVTERASIAKSLDAKLALLKELKKARESSTSGYTAKPTPEIPRLRDNAKFCPDVLSGADIKPEFKSACEKSAEDANTARLSMISAINDQNFWTARVLEQVAEGNDASLSRAEASKATGELNRQYQAYWNAWNDWDAKFRKIVEANNNRTQYKFEATGKLTDGSTTYFTRSATPIKAWTVGNEFQEWAKECRRINADNFIEGAPIYFMDYVAGMLIEYGKLNRTQFATFYRNLETGTLAASLSINSLDLAFQLTTGTSGCGATASILMDILQTKAFLTGLLVRATWDVILVPGTQIMGDAMVNTYNTAINSPASSPICMKVTTASGAHGSAAMKHENWRTAEVNGVVLKCA